METEEVCGGAKGNRNYWIPPEWVVRQEEIEPWPEEVPGSELLDELARTIEQFVVLPPWALEAAVLWIVHSYAFELRDVTTYLGIESPQHRCGKSTLLDILGLLVKRPVRAANISTPAFFRVIAETQPTLLIDEADTFLHSDELRGILNSGYQRSGAFVMRVTNEGPSLEQSKPQTAELGEKPPSGVSSGGRGTGTGCSRLVKFSCWCPKAIARIGRLPQTLADRCIVFTMQRKLPTEQCARLRTLDAETLRRKCARLVMSHAEEIREARPQVPEGLNDRASDIWEPLLAVADLAGGEWPGRARKAAMGLSASAAGTDVVGTLLTDIAELYLRSQKERIFTRDVAGWLNLAEDRPWMVLKKGKTVTGQWVAQQLAAFGIRPKTLRIEKERAKGYEWDDFREAFRRYVPRADFENLKAEFLRELEESKKEEKGWAESGDGQGKV